MGCEAVVVDDKICNIFYTHVCVLCQFVHHTKQMPSYALIRQNVNLQKSLMPYLVVLSDPHYSMPSTVVTFPLSQTYQLISYPRVCLIEYPLLLDTKTKRPRTLSMHDSIFGNHDYAQSFWHVLAQKFWPIQQKTFVPHLHICTTWSQNLVHCSFT